MATFKTPFLTTLLITSLTIVLPPIAARGAQQTLFNFHSAFWLNLHHYLHALARADSPLREDLPPSASDAERMQWGAAVEFYRTRYGKRRLVFDATLVGIKQQLTPLESEDTLEKIDIAPELRRVLERVAPIYRKYHWPEHDASNRKYITALQQLVLNHGRAIAARLAHSYEDDWPAEGFRVDVVHDAGPPGNAYTTTVPRPTHVTIGADFRGLTSLELIFHESSHHWDQQLMKAVDDAAKEANVKRAPELWHALLFYNAGRITADALAAAGVRDYQLMMVEGSIFARPGWHAAIGRHWPSFLSGDISRHEAILRILRELTVP